MWGLVIFLATLGTAFLLLGSLFLTLKVWCIVVGISLLLSGIAVVAKVPSFVKRFVLRVCLKGQKPSLVCQFPVPLLGRKTAPVAAIIAQDEQRPWEKHVVPLIRENIRSILGFDSYVAYGEEKLLLTFKCFQEAHDLRVVGIIGMPCRSAGTLRQLMQERGIDNPIISLDRRLPGRDFPFVGVTNTWGSRMGTDYLIRQGYERIILVTGDESILPIAERNTGYRIATRRGGLNEKVFEGFSVCFGDIERKSRTGRLRRFIHRQSKEEALAFFTANSRIGETVVDIVIKEFGEWPWRWAIVSFDGFAEIGLGNLPILAHGLEQPKEEIAGEAVRMLQRVIAGKPIGRREVLLPTCLV